MTAQRFLQRYGKKDYHLFMERLPFKHAHFLSVYVVIVHTFIFLDAVKLCERGYIYLPF